MEPQRDRDGYWRSLSESINKIAEDYRLSSAELAQSAIAFHRAAAAGTAEKVKQSSQVSGSNSTPGSA